MGSVEVDGVAPGYVPVVGGGVGKLSTAGTPIEQVVKVNMLPGKSLVIEKERRMLGSVANTPSAPYSAPHGFNPVDRTDLFDYLRMSGRMI
ncbi:MAG: hypothetical protein LBF24_00340 [Puniceicoccales bacterium]|jgi:hypothetical protein|nr:hypothetical protein [Puniceicoccales bacterium]